MKANQSPKVTAVVSGAGLIVMLSVFFTTSPALPWRIVIGVVALLLATKIVVALRADRPAPSHLEQTLRRLTFVDRQS